MNEEQLRATFRGASEDFFRLNSKTGPSDIQPDDSGKAPKLERTAGHGALVETQAKIPTGQHFLVRITSHRKRLLDEDNLCAKYLVDLCRYAGIIPGDSPGTAKIEVAQEKVGPKEPERVTIEIYAV